MFNCRVTITQVILNLLLRPTYHHQRLTERGQAACGGHDSYHLLPDGLRPICSSGERLS